jgi:chromosome segregation ATPase
MDQRKELENRNEIVTALQRNFEALSMFCKKERGENQSLKMMNDKLREENQKFLEKVTTMGDKIKCLSDDNDLLAKDRVKLKKVCEENQDLQIQLKVLEKQMNTHKNNYKKSVEMHEKTKEDLAKARKDYKMEAEKVGDLIKRLDEVKSSIDGVKKEYEAKILELKDGHFKIEKQLKEELDRLRMNAGREQSGLMDDLQKSRNRVKELETELKEMQKSIDTMDKLLKDQYAKYEELNQKNMGIKDSLMNKANSHQGERQELLDQIKDLNKSKDVLKAQYSEL